MSFRQIIWCCMLFSCISLSAQQKQKGNATINIPGAGKELQCSFEYDYSLADSTRVLDGILNINGSRNEDGVNENFSLQGYATKGRLDGAINSTYSLEGKRNDEKHYISFIYNATFKNGLPHGETKINSFGQKSSAYDVKMNFNEGVLTGNFKFNAFLKEETSISGAFTNEGKMNGNWQFWYYDLKARKDEKIIMTLSNGIQTSGEGYTKELEQLAKEYADGKISLEKLHEKGVDIITRKEVAAEKAISDALRNRFIPFDALASMDLSKISISYEHLDYFPSIDTEGFAMVLKEIEGYNGYVLPDADVFGIYQDGRNKMSYKSFDTTFNEHINHANWNEKGLCNVYFTKQQQNELNRKLEEAQAKWKTGAVAICRSNYDLLIEQQLLNKSAAEISSLMTNAIKRGYKVDSKPTEERYKAHTPIIKFESSGISAPEDSTAVYKYTSRINVHNPDSLGYRTYQWYISIRSTDPNNLYNDLNESFTADNFHRIKNEYDTINGLIGEIDRNSKIFESAAPSAMHNPMAGYSAYINSAKSIDSSDLPGTTERLQQVLEFQKEFELWLSKSIALKEADAQIRQNAQKHKDIMTEYDSHLKQTDISWSKSNSLENLIKLEQTQKDILKFVNASCEVAANNKEIRSHREEFEKLIKAYGSYIKTVDLSWADEANTHKLDSVICIQSKTLKFIELRQQIVKTHKELLAAGNRYDYILDAYLSYIENVDVAWTKDVNTSKLEAILKIQESCKTLFKQPDIKATNKAVRKEKLKDISIIIERFIK